MSPTILPALIGIYVVNWLGGLLQVATWTAIFFTVSITAAFAQDAPAAAAMLSPFLEAVLGILGSAFLGGALWIIRRVSKVLKLQSDEQMRGVLYPILERGVDLAVAEIREQVGSARLPFFKSEILDKAVRYAVFGAPDVIKHFGVGDDWVRKMLEARLKVKYPETITEPGLIPDPDGERIEAVLLSTGEATPLAVDETT